MYVILVYDIQLDVKGKRVLRRVFKICKKYLHHIQNSVFEGEITKAQIEMLHAELNKYIRKDQDSIILFSSRSERWLEKKFWGIDTDFTSNQI